MLRVAKFSILVLVSILTLLFYSNAANAAGTVTVKGSALNGWAMVNDNPPNPANGGFESGPGAVPAGTGSARLALANLVGSKMVLNSMAYSGVPLSQITELKYSTYRRSVDSGKNLAISLSFDMDYDLTDTTTTFQRRLTFEPYLSPGVGGNILQNTWYNWDAIDANARWWMNAGGAYPAKVNNADATNHCPQGSPCTWAQVQSYYPNAGIRTPLGFVHLGAGSNWAGFDGNVDNFIIGVNGDSTTYDFENETGCGTPCVITVKPSSLMGWVPIEETATGAASFVTGPGSPPLGVGSAQIDVSGNGGSGGGEYVMTPAYAGTLLSNITALQYSSLRQTIDGSNSTSVNLQFDTDFDVTDGSSAWQGRLLYVPANEAGVPGTILQNTWYTWNPIGANARWWITGTPKVGGSDAANPCPLFGTTCSWATILSTFPNAAVHPVYQEFGLKQGSGEGIITSNFDALLIGVSGNNIQYDFEPDTTCTSDCYVNWTTGNDAYDGKTATTARHSFVSAITSLTSGGTVHAANGTYIENVLINKPLTLVGASQAGVIVRPSITNPNCGGGGGGSLCAGSSNVLLVQADNVTIHDLTVDGDNTFLTSAYNVGGANLDARNGIITNHNAGVYNNLEIYNTTTKNIYLRGVYASSGGTFNFHDNTVTNVQGETQSIAMMNFGGSGYFTDNTVSYANDAIASNWSTGTEYDNNTVTNSGSGVHSDNNNTTADNIHDNTVSACLSGGYGVWVFSPYVATTLNNNSVTGCDVGLASARQSAAVAPIFTNNTSDGNDTGAFVTTQGFGWGSTNVATDFTNNDILNSVTDGFYLEGETSYVLIVNANNNNVTSSGAKGFNITGDGTRNVTAHYNNISANGTGGAQGLRQERKRQAAPPKLPRSVNVTEPEKNLDKNIAQPAPRAPEAGTGTLDFTGNWWGNASGPAHTLNPSGTGDSVNDAVYYSPWLGIGTDSNVAVGFQIASPMTWIVHPNVCLPNGANVKCNQQAIDLGAAGDTLTIHAGNFPEQVNINKANLTLNGAGSSSTIIKPNAVTANTTKLSNAAPADVILLVDGVSGASINSLRVDGSTAAFNACAPEYYGVYFRNGTGTLNTSDVRNIYHPSAGGCQGVVGVLVHSNTGSKTVNLTSNSITNYGKNGITCNFLTGATTLTCNVTGNTVTGRGPLGSGEAAQNGVQIGFGATGVVNGNTVSANSYTPFTTVATGILLYQSDVNAANNIISENQMGLYVLEGSGTFNGNTISATASGTGSPGFWGAYFDDPPPWRKPQPMMEGKTRKMSSPEATNATQTIVFTNNTLTSNGSAGGIGFEADAGFGANDLDITANYNVVRNWGSVGMEFVQCTGGGCAASVFTGVIAHHNRIVDNTVGLETSTCTSGGSCSAGSLGITIDAENNWWGCNYGPGNTGAGCPIAANSATGSVDTAPYLVLKNAIAPTSIYAYQTSSHSADLRFNSNNNNTSGSGYIPNNTPLSWSATLGSMSPTSNGTSSGTAASTFTSNGTVGTANLGVTVDGQTLSGDVAVLAPTDVLVTFFKVKYAQDRVRLTWQTSFESNLTGFNVWRARGKGEFTKLNTDLIPANAIGSVNGSTYTYTDSPTRKGKYTYKLEIVSSNNRSQWSETVTVRVKKSAACATAPRAPKFLSPQADARLDSRIVLLKWKALPCATHYTISIRADASDGTLIAQANNLQAPEFRTKRLSRGKSYWATVQACNAQGCGAGQTRQFHIQGKKE